MRSLILLAVLLVPPAWTQPFTISTLAGVGTYSGDLGPATSAVLNLPSGIAFDQAGNVYLADTLNHRIRVIDSSGNIRTVAGNGSGLNNGDGSPAISAATGSPKALVMDAAGNLYFTAQNSVRKLDTAGIVTTLAGANSPPPGSTCTATGDGGPAISATICGLKGLARDSHGTFYIVDGGRIRSFSAGGIISTIAGSATLGNSGDGGPASAATFGKSITALAVDSSDNLYIADSANGAIRKIDANRNITAVLSQTALQFQIQWIAFDPNGALYYSSGPSVYRVSNGVSTLAATGTPDSYVVVGAFAFGPKGTLYLSDQFENYILSIAAGKQTLVAGSNPNFSPSGSRAADVYMNLSGTGLAVDDAGDVFFFEEYNDLPNSLVSARLDKVTPDGTVTVLLGSNTLLNNSDGNSSRLTSAGLVAVDPAGQTIYFTANSQIFRLQNGNVLRYAGKVRGGSTDSGDGGQAINAVIGGTISGMALDRQGNLYFSEAGNSSVVRQIDTGGTIHLVAGSTAAGFSDGGAGGSRLSNPEGLAVDSSGNLQIADYGNHRVRKVTASTFLTTTIAGNGQSGLAADGVVATAASMTGPNGVAVDASGKLYFSDGLSHLAGYLLYVQGIADNRIRVIDGAGNLTTVAGSGIGGSAYGDGLLATQAELNEPQTMAADAEGNLYFVDAGNSKIRKLTPGAPAPPPPTLAVTSVNVAGGGSDLAPNTWIEIKGVNLAPAGDSVVWSAAPEFLQSKMPTKLDGVSVTVGGKPAYIYYVSPTQVNALTPLDATAAQVQIIVTNGANSTAPFTVNRKSVSPGFLRFGATAYIAATHALGNLLGPASLSVPGYTFTPASINETVVFYGDGFGLPAGNLVEGSSVQVAALPQLPVIRINNSPAQVTYGGVVAPGLYQFNVVIPSGVKDGDNSVTCDYGGGSVPVGALITIKL